MPIPANQVRKHCISWSIGQSIKKVLYSNIQKIHKSTQMRKGNDVPAILFIFLKTLLIYFIIYLAVLCLSCGMQDLFLSVHRLSGCVMRNQYLTEHMGFSSWGWRT